MLHRLEVPEALHRNSAEVAAAGYEHTGQLLIDLATRSAGFQNLNEIDVLDVGCGVRFAMTIINRGIPIKSYTGVEIDKQIVEFLQEQVEARDQRFRFFHWNVRNQMYNPGGVELTPQTRFPVKDSFDLIWLFSVFTHLNAEDAELLLHLLRQHVRKDGRLFFSAFIDEDIDGFDDRVKSRPLENAYYGKNYMQRLLERTGWRIVIFHEKDPANHVQHYFVCAPV